MLSTFLLIGFFVIHSIKQKITREPSRAGIGRRLNTARLTPIKDAMYSRYLKPPVIIALVVTEIVVIVPPIEVIPSLALKSG